MYPKQLNSQQKIWDLHCNSLPAERKLCMLLSPGTFLVVITERLSYRKFRNIFSHISTYYSPHTRVTSSWSIIFLITCTHLANFFFCSPIKHYLWELNVLYCARLSFCKVEYFRFSQLKRRVKSLLFCVLSNTYHMGCKKKFSERQVVRSFLWISMYDTHGVRNNRAFLEQVVGW